MSVKFVSWFGRTVDAQYFEPIMDIIKPLGLDTLRIACNYSSLIDDTLNNNNLSSEDTFKSGINIVFADGACRSSYQSWIDSGHQPCATKATVGDTLVQWEYIRPPELYKAPGIPIDLCFDLKTSSPSFAEYVKSYPIAYVYYPNTINICLRQCISPWDTNYVDPYGGHELEFTESQLAESLVTLLQHIITAATPYLNTDMSTFKIYENIEQEKNWIKQIADVNSKERENILNQITGLYGDIDTWNSKIKNAKSKLKILENNLENISNIQDAAVGKIHTELEKIKNIDDIISVELSCASSNTLTLYTNNIYARTQGMRFYFGRYRIVADICKGTVSFFNLEESLCRHGYWGNKCQHPHVSGEGRPCLGNVRDDIKTAIDNFEFGYLAILCLSFLSNVNILDAAGSYVISWPLVDDDGNVIQDSVEELLRCKECNELLPDDDTILQREAYGCAICGRHFHFACKQAHTVSSSGSNLVVCDDCNRESACPVCGAIHHEVEMSTDELTGERACFDCLTPIEVVDSSVAFSTRVIFTTPEHAANQALVDVCSSCNRLFRRRDGDNGVCEYCSDNGNDAVIYCNHCDTFKPFDLILKFDSHDGTTKNVCSECIGDYVLCTNTGTYELKEHCTENEQGEWHYLYETEE